MSEQQPMRGDADIAPVGALIGDPTRARVLMALPGGRPCATAWTGPSSHFQTGVSTCRKDFFTSSRARGARRARHQTTEMRPSGHGARGVRSDGEPR
jgi:hypothetical protein